MNKTCPEHRMPLSENGRCLLCQVAAGLGETPNGWKPTREDRVFLRSLRIDPE